MILQINQSGSWRTVLSFPGAVEEDVKEAVVHLVFCAAASTVKIRICEEERNLDNGGITAGNESQRWKVLEGWQSA